MPASSKNQSTFRLFRHDFETFQAASSIEGTAEEEYATRSVDPTFLVDGVNWIAVELHQASSSNSDVRFDLFLETNPTLSTPPSQPPPVAILNPIGGQSFPYPADIDINMLVNVADSDGVVTNVDFYVRSAKLGSDFDPPFTYSWTGVAPGHYTLNAAATGDSGQFKFSIPITVTVVDPRRPFGANPRYHADRRQLATGLARHHIYSSQGTDSPDGPWTNLIPNVTVDPSTFLLRWTQSFSGSSSNSSHLIEPTWSGREVLRCVPYGTLNWHGHFPIGDANIQQ